MSQSPGGGDDDDGGVIILGRALVRRILEHIPANHPDRPEIEAKLAEKEEDEQE